MSYFKSILHFLRHDVQSGDKIFLRNSKQSCKKLKQKIYLENLSSQINMRNENSKTVFGCDKKANCKDFNIR